MKKIFVAIAGGTVLLIGVVMIILPGPAILVIPLGLGILATEFAWAKSYKDKLDAKWAQIRSKIKPAPAPAPTPDPAPTPATPPNPAPPDEKSVP
jgi:hypothetical protein